MSFTHNSIDNNISNIYFLESNKLNTHIGALIHEYIMQQSYHYGWFQYLYLVCDGHFIASWELMSKTCLTYLGKDEVYLYIEKWYEKTYIAFFIL